MWSLCHVSSTITSIGSLTLHFNIVNLLPNNKFISYHTVIGIAIVQTTGITHSVICLID